MIHVDDVAAGLAWYQRAFPLAERVTMPSADVACLQIGSVQLELVQADNKVAAGPAGSVVYWRVPQLRDAMDRFESLGAGAYRGPMHIEDGQGMCQVRDPWGNCIGLRGPFEARIQPL